ncbi:zeta-sarcoglycan-like isoform X2 [Amphibalanus amphitrite]|uniref:zeta-sarcoglycan-like isoform X2 n=1 Tax=Amphibalanus amphitrite TaxID=1232801 RepID=UPI001C925D1D|nr:zeta-sarcoglycan-like isoform X2 [Amphibalanus amphitrite]XP_043190318.1 zeta-sarcoglycan-like isoform X2 [Amphibalanus amphitrite]XP_043190319.1 zeta-sarcoglycan-like isoform X2 [Amphibalanus amphitrite]
MGEGQGQADPYLYIRSYKIGIFGWRKRCLYGLLLVLLLMVIINLALTLWIMKVLDFSVDGIGDLRVVKGGIVLEGDSWVLNQLVASHIRSSRHQPISFQSSKNFSINVRNAVGELESQLTLGSHGLHVMSNSFRVTDKTGVTLFEASPHQVTVGANTLQVTGNGGAVFDGSVATPLVLAEAGDELKLESATRSLQISAPLGVAIESRAGDISAACLTDLKLQSTGGSIRIDSPRVMLPSLPIASTTSQLNLNPVDTKAYQVCACTSGKLFVTPAEGSCVADGTTCQ